MINLISLSNLNSNLIQSMLIIKYQFLINYHQDPIFRSFPIKCPYDLQIGISFYVTPICYYNLFSILATIHKQITGMIKDFYFNSQIKPTSLASTSNNLITNYQKLLQYHQLVHMGKLIIKPGYHQESLDFLLLFSLISYQETCDYYQLTNHNYIY